MKQIAIVGLGLIGGSIALALKKSAGAEHIVGYSANPADAQQALAAGAIDEIAASAADAACGSELAVLATPPGTLGGLARQLCEADAQLVVTDTGSVKRPLARAAAALPAGQRERVVPGHPVAGTEHSGFGAACADLFTGCTVVLTPAEDTGDAAVALVEQFWRGLDATTISMTADEHDALFAWSSHLPHLVAWALSATVAGNTRGPELLQLSAGGLRDFTRIASSDPELWSEIIHLNRDNMQAAIEGFSKIWQRLSEQIADGDTAPLEQFLRQAGEAVRAERS